MEALIKTERSLPGRTRVVDSVVKGELVSRTLYADASCSQECARLWETGDYTHLGIAELENPGLDAVAFLAEFPSIQRLHVLLDRKVDLQPVEHHAGTLTSFFSNDDVNGLPDLRPYECLASLGQKWSAKTIFPAEWPVLERLSLVGFQPASGNLARLPAGKHLKTLNLMNTKIRSFDGLERWPTLNDVAITRAPLLEDISPLTRWTFFEHLAFEKCPVLADFSDAVRQCDIRKLEYLGCAPLPSIGFVHHMPSLQFFVFLDTDVLDGDMKPLIEHVNLKHVAFARKKHFSHSDVAVLKLLRAKQLEAASEPIQ